MTFALWNAIAFALYLAAAACNGAVLFLRAPAAPLLTQGKEGGLRAEHWGRPLLGLGLLAQFVAIGVWCMTTHHSPFASAYGTMAVLAWIIALAYLVVDWRSRLPAVGAIALLVACIVLFWGSLHAHNDLANASYINNQMVSLHVLAILASFALFALAFGCATLYLIQNRLLKAPHIPETLRRLPPLSTLDGVAYHSVAFALPLLTLGLALGIVFIYSGVRPSTSAHWYADPTTLLSFVAWGLYVVYLAARLGLGWRGVRLQYILLAGLVLALAVYALPSTLHRFG